MRLACRFRSIHSGSNTHCLQNNASNQVAPPKARAKKELHYCIAYRQSGLAVQYSCQWKPQHSRSRSGSRSRTPPGCHLHHHCRHRRRHTICLLYINATKSRAKCIPAHGRLELILKEKQETEKSGTCWGERKRWFSQLIALNNKVQRCAELTAEPTQPTIGDP